MSEAMARKGDKNGGKGRRKRQKKRTEKKKKGERRKVESITQSKDGVRSRCQKGGVLEAGRSREESWGSAPGGKGGGLLQTYADEKKRRARGVSIQKWHHKSVGRGNGQRLITKGEIGGFARGTRQKCGTSKAKKFARGSICRHEDSGSPQASCEAGRSEVRKRTKTLTGWQATICGGGIVRGGERLRLRWDAGREKKKKDDGAWRRCDPGFVHQGWHGGDHPKTQRLSCCGVYEICFSAPFGAQNAREAEGKRLEGGRGRL